MWVVKLGGSLASAPQLPAWLEALAATDALIVPGGGPFADAVREAQARWHFGAQAAHDMAIVGMQQYGRMLLGMQPKFQTVGWVAALSQPNEWVAALSQANENSEILERQKAGNPSHGPAVWLPQPEMLNAAGIPASWDISSDSLAAWLAEALGAKHLLLVKSIASAPAATIDAQTLIAQGVIDSAFPSFAARRGFQAWQCGIEDYRLLPAAFAQPESHLVRIGMEAGPCKIPSPCGLVYAHVL